MPCEFFFFLNTTRDTAIIRKKIFHYITLHDLIIRKMIYLLTGNEDIIFIMVI